MPVFGCFQGRAIARGMCTTRVYQSGSPKGLILLNCSGKQTLRSVVVPRKGLEPSRPLSHWHLKPARLPIPPPGPGPVSTDRSRACQIASTPPKCAVQRRAVGVSRNGLIPCDLSTLTLRKWTPMASNLDTLVTVFGGSGFVGRSVVRALAKRDYRIRVAGRRPGLAG